MTYARGAQLYGASHGEGAGVCHTNKKGSVVIAIWYRALHSWLDVLLLQHSGSCFVSIFRVIGSWVESFLWPFGVS